MLNKKLHSAGFTIVELMIATLVFSVILTIATVGILNIGRLYRKSLTQSQTQQVARTILDTVSQNIKFNGGSVVSGTNYYCLGAGKRLSYSLDTQFISSNTHGLVIDDIACTSTTVAQTINSSTISGKELLGPRMRLAQFYICWNGMTASNDCQSAFNNNLKSNTFFVKVRVVYGDTDLLTTDKQSCLSNAGREFCAVSEISTYVQKVLQ